MSIDNLINKADEKILQGCQYVVKQSNEYLGTNKYDLARLCDGVNSLSLLYMVYADLSARHLLTIVRGFCWVLGAQDSIEMALSGNKNLECLEEEAQNSGVIEWQLKRQIEKDKDWRFYNVLCGLLISSLAYFYPDKPNELYAPNALNMLVIGGCMSFYGNGLAMYFRSCDFKPRKKGKVFDWLDDSEKDLVPQEAEVNNYLKFL